MSHGGLFFVYWATGRCHFWYTQEVTPTCCQHLRGTPVFGQNLYGKMTPTIEVVAQIPEQPCIASDVCQKWHCCVASDTCLGLAFLLVSPSIPIVRGYLDMLPKVPFLPIVQHQFPQQVWEKNTHNRTKECLQKKSHWYLLAHCTRFISAILSRVTPF